MATLRNQPFNLYTAGVYQGTIRFTGDAVMWARVEPRQRTQMQEEALGDTMPFALPLYTLRDQLDDLAGAHWAGETVRAGAGVEFTRHRRLEDVVDGRPEVGQIWAHREQSAVDVVTVDGAICAFVRAHRSGMEVLVRPGYEGLTPLVGYDDPLLSKPRYGINDLGTFLVPMRDGVRLATDVYLPEGIAPGTRLPAILVRTCYDRRRDRTRLMHWVNKGYAVVNQDVRGRSDSEGDLVPFYYERDDGSDTIDWIAAQSWSNGNVGMWGASYLGYVAVAAATSGNPHLKAVVDEVNVGSPFVDTVRRGGTLCSWPLLSWTLAQSVGQRTDFDVFNGISVSPEQAVEARPVAEIPTQIIGRRSGPWDLWRQHPEYDDFWRNCTFTERGDAVSVPMFVISGWFDGDSAGVSETWRMLSTHDVPHRKIWLGPWEHQPNRARDLMGVHFSNDAVVYHYDIQVLRWFDRFLKGIPNGIDQEPRAAYYLMGENRWLHSEDWPPEASALLPFYLASGGRANSRLGDGRLAGPALPGPCGRDGDAPFDQYRYDPRDPIVDGGEREPENLRGIELRSDMLVYTSEPLTEPLAIAGELSARIYASSTGQDTDWAVWVSDVHPNGDSIRLSQYILRALYRNGLDAPAPLTPGSIERYDIFLPNVAHVFEAGHRVRVSIGSSSKMVSFPNPNTGDHPYAEVRPVPVTQTIYHSEQYPSAVQLPVLSSSSSSANQEPANSSESRRSARS